MLKNLYIKSSVSVFFILVSFILLCISLFPHSKIPVISILFLFNYALLVSNGSRYGKSFFLSPFCIFFYFFYFYSNTFPLLFEYGNMNFFSVKESALIFTYSYSLRFLSSTVFLFCLFPNIFIYEFNFSRKNIKKKTSFTLVFVAIILLFIEFCYFVLSGYLSFFLSGTTTRTDINTYVQHYNIWTYLGYLNIFLMLELFLSESGKVIRKILVCIPIIFYYVVSIFSGSRKQLLYILIILGICYFLKIVKIKKTFFLLLFGLFFAAVFYRTVVMDKGFQGDVFARIAGIGGEFIFPTITFPLSIQKGFGTEDFNYPTILDSVLYFVPRFIFPLKNYSIGESFSRMMDVNMGFAINPMLEAYINFGNAGYIIDVFLFALLFLFIKKISKKNFYFYIYATIFLIDLNRGEISFYIRQLITISVTLYFLNLVFQSLLYILPYKKEQSL